MKKMIIAVPVSRGRLARHFTKAKQIAFYHADFNASEFHLSETLDNPACGGNCADKKAMLNLIKSKGANMVLVDMIGERMLGKLLDTGAIIAQGDSSSELMDVLNQCQRQEFYLTSAAQGRRSLNHEKKGGCGGGCGCGGHSHKEEKTSLLTMDLASQNNKNLENIHFSGFRKV